MNIVQRIFRAADLKTSWLRGGRSLEEASRRIDEARASAATARERAAEANRLADSIDHHVRPNHYAEKIRRSLRTGHS